MLELLCKESLMRFDVPSGFSHSAARFFFDTLPPQKKFQYM